MGTAGAALLFFAVGCGDGSPGREAGEPDAAPQPECIDDADCDLESACEGGDCVRRSGAALGETCASDEDCASRSCLPSAGICSWPCAAPSDCPAGTGCGVFTTDDDGDGVPESVETGCVPARDGGSAAGASCAATDACASGTCHWGVCADPCASDDDCSGDARCALVAAFPGGTALLPGGCAAPYQDAPRVRLCLPSRGVLSRTFGERAGETYAIDVPPGAVSVSFLQESEDEPLIGIEDLEGPDGPLSPEWPIEGGTYRMGSGNFAAALTVPWTPDLPFGAGTYCATARADAAGSVETRAFLKMSPDGEVSSGRLDLVIHFLDVADDVGCGYDGIDAATAPDHALLRRTLGQTASILWSAGIEIGEITYVDLPADDALAEIDVAETDERGRLLSLGADGSALDVFFVHRLREAASLNVWGWSPVPVPPVHGTPKSGIVMSWQHSCQGPDALGATLAHEIGHALGLCHIENDSIADTDSPRFNLMVDGGAGEELTDGQAFVMLRHPIVQ